MSLENDLLQQARQLAQLDRFKPRQANLRRAVSTAYYALFHLLVREATRRFTTNSDLRVEIGRCFDHSEMKKCCKTFAKSGGLPEPWRTSTGSPNVPVDLRFVAKIFIGLQEARHEADYDLGQYYQKREVMNFLAQAEGAFQAWLRIRETPVAHVFLLGLLFHDRWKR